MHTDSVSAILWKNANRLALDANSVNPMEGQMPDLLQKVCTQSTCTEIVGKQRSLL